MPTSGEHDSVNACHTCLENERRHAPLSVPTAAPFSNIRDPRRGMFTTKSPLSVSRLVSGEIRYEDKDDYLRSLCKRK